MVVSDNMQTLCLYLKGLPTSLPVPQDSRYKFLAFAPDPDWVADIGIEGAVNRQLEIIMGSRAKGPLTFSERGCETEALAEVLERYLGEIPNSIILQKWLSDAIDGAKETISRAGKRVIDGSISSEEHGGGLGHLVTARFSS